MDALNDDTSNIQLLQQAQQNLNNNQQGPAVVSNIQQELFQLNPMELTPVQLSEVTADDIDSIANCLIVQCGRENLSKIFNRHCSETLLPTGVTLNELYNVYNQEMENSRTDKTEIEQLRADLEAAKSEVRDLRKYIRGLEIEAAIKEWNVALNCCETETCDFFFSHF